MSEDEAADCGCNDCGCAGGAGTNATQGDTNAGGTDSFHPMGAEWESEMEAMLDDTEYDTDLGMKISEDAQRLVAGEISEREFYEEYHDAVVAEFGVDDRPMSEQFEGLLAEDRGFIERLRNFDEADEESRRNLMKKMGAAGAFLGLGGLATKENADGADPSGDVASAQEGFEGGEDDEGVEWGMVIDLERCDGCLQCVIGCAEENNTSTGANWMYVLTYEDDETDQENFLVRPCQHCNNAPCAKVCPVRARHIRDEDGIVLTNYETCIGCRYCQVACPYGVNYFQWGEPDVPRADISEDHIYDDRGLEVDSRPPKGVMGKCTFCPSRQDGLDEAEGHNRGTVACMDSCDAAGMSAIHFGDMNDPESRPRRYLQRRAEQEFDQGTELDEEGGEEFEDTVTPWGKLSAFRLQEDLGTEPSVVYLGNEPGPHAEQVEGPVQYEDLSLENDVEVVDRRKDHLDQGASANSSGE